MCLTMTLINKIIMKLYVAPGTSISSTRAQLSSPLSKLTDLDSSAPIWLWDFLPVSFRLVHSGICCFCIPTRNTGVPPGGVTNPFLCCLFTQDLFMAFTPLWSLVMTLQSLTSSGTRMSQPTERRWTTRLCGAWRTTCCSAPIKPRKLS